MPPRRKRCRTTQAAEDQQEGADTTTEQELSTEMRSAIAQAVAAEVQKLATTLSIPNRPNQNPQVQFVPDNNITATVQTSVSAAVQEITGGTPNTGTPETSDQTAGINKTQHERSNNPFMSTAIPLGSMVSDKIKSKIWANEFVNFELLLNTRVTDDSYSIKLTNDKAGGSQALTIIPNQKRQTINNIETWTNAFQIFAAVYTEKLPQEAPALMKYSATVRDLAKNFSNWKFYDENFRVLREKQPVPWDTIHSELWLRASQRKQSSTEGKGFRPSTVKRNDPLQGYCFKYSRGKQCTGCNYKHQCHKCQGNHPSCKCPQNHQSHERNTSTIVKSLPKTNATNTNQN